MKTLLRNCYDALGWKARQQNTALRIREGSKRLARPIITHTNCKMKLHKNPCQPSNIIEINQWHSKRQKTDDFVLRSGCKKLSPPIHNPSIFKQPFGDF